LTLTTVLLTGTGFDKAIGEPLDWTEWKPWYERIVEDFGFDRNKDLEAAKLLAGQLKDRKLVDDGQLRNLFGGKTVIIFGPALDTLAGCPLEGVKIAAGASASILLKKFELPDVTVTDLDGDVSDQLKASQNGAITVIHAHGDNMDALREQVGKFKGPVLGTCQVEEVKPLRNFGGFTDGDRAVFLAGHFGAKKIILLGFDFEKPVVKKGKDPAVKKKKLAYAKELIDFAARHFDVDIVLQ
jgi:uncharacterized Rossmann fold enzyme